MMFSIIIPSYNRNNEIKASLDSLQNQTYHNFEVIIVDDNSKIAVTLDKNYPFEVSIIRNNQNVGAAESRNIGVKKAKNDWVLFLDDDDRFANNKCEMLTQAITAHPNINFIYHPAKCEMVNEKFTYITRPYKQKEQLTIENILFANKIGGMPLLAITKSLFEKVGGLSSQLRSIEDYEFLLKVIIHPEFNPYYIDEPLTYYTLHTQRSSVSTDTLNTEKAIQYIQKNYVKTEQQAFNFKLNSLYMLAYTNIMNLSRKAARYYFAMFKQTKNIKMLIIAMIIMISPKLAIHLKRFI